MKKFLTFILIVAGTGIIYAKDYHKTREMIDTILTEESDAAEAELKEKEKQQLQQEGDKTGENTENGQEKKDDAGTMNDKNKMSGKDASVYKSALQLYENGFYDAALVKFNDIIKNYPDSKFIDFSRICAGRIYIKQYKYDEAIKEFDSIKETSGEYPSSLYYKAEAFRYKGDKVSSIEFYQKFASEYPQDKLAPNSILNAGKLYMNNKQGAQALEAAIKLIKEYPDRDTIDDAYYLIAKIYEKDPALKDVETARKYYKLFLKKAANNEKYFFDSPLLPAIKRDLEHLEKTHFRSER